ncbi:hypothetical protein ALC57_18399 [Trachymyrmex cornetzi]|uniref:Uncharacterized protein n=1 Tax=Trachymyrmex cornetzi TaxID=471704 RepID=A0A151ISB3_9HYME|nr:hypothetical protein ALC57_18399 [Trachymyrmex cornetzi]
MENHERVERELLEQCGQVATLAECFAWLQRCDECIERLEEMTGAVINSNRIEPRRFLEDASNIVLERVRDAVERHGSVKVNTAFNGEFATKDKRANKSIITKNSEIYRCTDIRECPRYTTVFNLTNIEFQMTLKDIPKFEHLNAVSINVYGIENEQVLPLRLTGDKKEKHVNLLYLQDPYNNVVTHFAWIKNLSRLVRSQLTRKKNKKYFCDRAKDCRRTMWTAKTTIHYHCISSVAITIASRGSRDSSTIWRIASKISYPPTLDKLASYLDKDKLKIVRSEFSTLSDEEFELLTRKGIFPYEYIDRVEKSLTIARIIFQFIDGRYSIRERLCSRRERMAAILHSNVWQVQGSVLENRCIVISRHF